LIDAIRSGLAARANAEKAKGMQAYMKSAMPYYGVQSTPLRELCRSVFPQFELSFEEWRTTVLTLWDEAHYREERYAALELLGDRRYKQYRILDALPLYQHLIVSGAWWDLVDGLATHLVRDLLAAHPDEMRAVLKRWSSGEDLWLRRTSIICQVSLRSATDTALLTACIAPNLSDKDFFIRKAIGWALREYAKANPDWVRTYVEQHTSELSTLSKREALKHLT
jgi:3-methyladenine DNA glycosylase AlkD